VSDYANKVMAGIRSISRLTELSMFTGWVSGRFECFSRCHSAEIYVRSLRKRIPHCSRCHNYLGPDDLRYEWVPPKKMDPNSTMDCPHPMDTPKEKD